MGNATPSPMPTPEAGCALTGVIAHRIGTGRPDRHPEIVATGWGLERDEPGLK